MLLSHTLLYSSYCCTGRADAAGLCVRKVCRLGQIHAIIPRPLPSRACTRFFRIYMHDVTTAELFSLHYRKPEIARRTAKFHGMLPQFLDLRVRKKCWSRAHAGGARGTAVLDLCVSDFSSICFSRHRCIVYSIAFERTFKRQRYHCCACLTRAPTPPLPPRIFQGGRQLLLDAALEAIKVAEDPANEGDRVLVARSFHTATVYLEVLSSFNAVSPGWCCVYTCGGD